MKKLILFKDGLKYILFLKLKWRSVWNTERPIDIYIIIKTFPQNSNTQDIFKSL